MSCNEIHQRKDVNPILESQFIYLSIVMSYSHNTFWSRIEKGECFFQIYRSHVLGSYLLHYLTQTSWALFWKGVGNVSENTTLGLSLLMKFRFSLSMGSVINVWSAANAHSDIFFFKSLPVAIVPNWNKKIIILKTILCTSYC